ncbi:MAG: PKD domain-containing protein [Armatimonadota bacterium]
MGYRWIALLGLALGLCGMAFAADDLLVVYNGDAALTTGITLGDWGFLPKQNPEKAFQPEQLSAGFSKKYFGLKLLLTSRYQGVRFDLQQPVDAAVFAGVKNTYLELYLRATPDDKPKDTVIDPNAPPNPMGPPNPVGPPPTVAPPPPADMPPPPPGGNPPPPPPPGGPGEQPGGNPTGAQGGLPPEFIPEAPKPVTVQLPTLTNLRFTFITDKGQGQLVVKPDDFFPKEEVNKQWIRVTIPLSTLNPKLPLTGNLKRILITSDTPSQLYLGRLAIVKDNVPLAFTAPMASFPPFMEAGKRIYFLTKVSTGLSKYEVTWDFDTRGGPSVDATGERPTYTYSTEGTYLITCTLRDLSGGKDPVTQTLQVKVSRAR